jgi:hypothetical protein
MPKVLIEINAVHTVLQGPSCGPSILWAKMPDLHLRKIEYSGQDTLPPRFLFNP